MAHYYRLDSDDGEETNLQLHAYRHGKALWEELAKDYADNGEDTEKLKETSVLVSATLGLSITQLLGQNNPALSGNVPYPKNIFSDFVDAHNRDQSLKAGFEHFNYFYNGCRHFGRTTGTRGYERIDELDFAVARECYEFGLEVWRAVIAVYRTENGSDLDNFEEENDC